MAIPKMKIYRLDENYSAQNCLAQSISIAVDQVVEEDMVYETAVATIRIKPGVKFWDGTELTAADVVYSLQQAQASPYFASGIVDGYFSCEVPMLFWRLLALYICINSIGSLPWAVSYGEDEIMVMRRQQQQILEW